MIHSNLIFNTLHVKTSLVSTIDPGMYFLQINHIKTILFDTVAMPSLTSVCCYNHIDFSILLYLAVNQYAAMCTHSTCFTM